MKNCLLKYLVLCIRTNVYKMNLNLSFLDEYLGSKLGSWEELASVTLCFELKVKVTNK